MNRYTKYIAGGALLATTALASGTVSAATVVDGAAAFNTNADITTGAYSAPALANTIFGGAATQASLIGVGTAAFTVRMSTTYSAQAAYTITLSGGEFEPGASVVGTKAQFMTGNVSLTGIATISTAITVISDKLVIQPTAADSTISAIRISGVTVKNLVGLATAGGTASIAGSVQNTAFTFAFESIASTTLLTSAVPASYLFTAVNTSASNSTTPAFVNFGSSSQLTASLADISLTLASVVGTNLGTILSGSYLISASELRITHGALSDPAFVNVIVYTGGTAIGTKTVAQTSSGVATFTLGVGALDGGALKLSIQVGFNGTTAITGGSGTAQVTPRAKSPQGAVAVASNPIGTISRGGLTASVNSFQNSFNSFSSFLRITNNGSSAGTYTVSVLNADTGASMGTYTGASLVPGATVQISAATLQTGASIATPTTFGSYTLNVSSAFNGYLQHIGFNPVTGALSDLSAFRNGTGQTAP